MQNTITKNFSENTTKQSFLHSDKNKNLLYIEKKLNQIFFDEMTSDNSIFRKVKNSAIHKMALFLSNNITSSFLLFIILLYPHLLKNLSSFLIPIILHPLIFEIQEKNAAFP